jgi:hypothetical protein
VNVLLLGLVNWVATCILVESELFREPREWVHMKDEVWGIVIDDGDERIKRRWRVYDYLWHKASYLVACQLCTGTWVGIALAIIFGSPFGTGLAAVVAGGLVYKAIGHLALETSAVLKGVANHG